MKNILKKTLCMLGAAAMLSSVLAIGASAALPIIYKPTTVTSAASETDATVEMLFGAKFYSTTSNEIANYFKANQYSFTMTVGEAKVLASDVLLYSENSAVVSIDETTGALKANAVGTTAVYVFTKNGVPFLKLNITVKQAAPLYDRIGICPVNPYLYTIGSGTAFTYTTPIDKYNDIILDIVSGKDYAYIQDGRLIATGYGPVVVRAYSKSCPNVFGETIVFVGKYNAPVFDGYWYTTNTGIYVNQYTWISSWKDSDFLLTGWIKTAEGLFLPVFKIQKEEIVGTNGNTYESTVLSFTTLKELMEIVFDDVATQCKPWWLGYTGCGETWIPVWTPCYGWTTGVTPLPDGTVGGYKPDAKPDVKPDYKPDYKPDAKPNVKPDCSLTPTLPVMPSVPSTPVLPAEPTTPVAKDDHITDLASLLAYLESLKQ